MTQLHIPIGSMYGICTYNLLLFYCFHVGKHTIHGSLCVYLMPPCLAGILGISTTNQHKKQPQAAENTPGGRWCPVPRHDDTKIHAVFEVHDEVSTKFDFCVGCKNGERL